MTDLHTALLSSDVARVRKVLQRDPSCVNDRNKDYQTPLHAVFKLFYLPTQTEGLSIFQTLLDYGADVNARQRAESLTPLHIAAERNKAEGIKLLLKSGADPNLRDDRNRTALHYVTLKSSETYMVALFMHYGADINAVDCDGRTPLDLAIHVLNPVVKYTLMDAGAKAYNGFFHTLVESNYSSLIFFIISNGVKIDIDGRFSFEALYYFCRKHQISLCKSSLLEQGVDIKDLERADMKMTKLHVAAQKMDENQVRALLEAGADVNAKNVFDETPLHLLFDKQTENDDTIRRDRSRIYRIAKLLVEAGADFYVRDLEGFTPLHLIVRMKYPNIINLMLAKIAGVDESTLGNQKTISWPGKVYPLAIAILLGYEEVVDRLIEMGHHVEASSNATFKSPLYYAINDCHSGMLKLLLEAGCEIDERYPYSISSIYLTGCNKDILKSTCLLWEFDCFPIIRSALIETFCHIIEFDSNRWNSLLVFYYKIGLHTNKLDEDFISMTGTFHSNEKLLSVLASCDDLIDELKKDQVCGNKSKYDLLTMKLDSLVNFLNDENNFKVIEKLRSSLNDDEDIESYKFAMNIRIDLAIEKRRILDSAKDCLNQSFQDILDFIKVRSLPEEITCIILSYLNARELKKMTAEDYLVQ